MTRLLIAIPSCDTYVGNDVSPNRDEPARRTACLDTWLKDAMRLGVDYRFFYGAGHAPTSDDQVTLDCPGDYDSLAIKFRAICRYALDHDYEFLFRVDTDAYVWVERLQRAGYEKHDYSGYTIDYPEHLAWARYASGAGWTLSRKGMEIVAGVEPEHTADDLWTGRILFRHGIRCHRDTRYCCGFQPHFVDLKFLPPVHSCIVLHALRPHEIREVHALPPAGDDITPPSRALFEPFFDFRYGRRSPHCGCPHCSAA